MNSRESQLTDYLVNELDQDQREAFERELRRDPAMADELEGLKETAAAIRGAFEAESYAFSPGELASLRQQVGLAPVAEGAEVFHLGRALWRGGAWVGAAAACVAGMFWLVNQDQGNELASGSDGGNTGVAGGAPNLEWLAPVTFSADPGGGSAQPELTGVPKILEQWPEPDQVASLRSPDLTRINRPTVLELEMKVGNGSYELLRSSVIEESKLPPVGMIRIDELSNVFADDLGPGSFLRRYQHPWRDSGAILLAGLPSSASEANLRAEGEGTLRLFGEQLAEADKGECRPVSLRKLESQQTRVWFMEGSLLELNFELRGGKSPLKSERDAEVMAWRSSSPAMRASLLLIGLGEYLRGSDSTPSESQLLTICETLRAESADIDQKFLDTVALTESAIRLKQAE